eukprot:764898-Hanusia_phi.AAC.4
MRPGQAAPGHCGDAAQCPGRLRVSAPGGGGADGAPGETARFHHLTFFLFLLLNPTIRPSMAEWESEALAAVRLPRMPSLRACCRL